MAKAIMSRTTAREIAMHFSFELMHTGTDAQTIMRQRFDTEYYPTLAEECNIYEILPDKRQLEYITRTVLGLSEHAYELDTYIETYSKGWRFERISRTALAIMRLAMFEILYSPDVPDAVALNEAVELAKKYEDEQTVPFINGILGSFLKGEKQ